MLDSTPAGRLRRALTRGVEGWRSRGPQRLRATSRTILRFHDLTLDPLTRDVRRAGRRIELTPIEFSLLELFLRHPGEVLTRGTIRTDVWGFDLSSSNSLTVYIGYLRGKIEAEGDPRLLHTVRGVGYVLRES